MVNTGTYIQISEITARIENAMRIAVMRPNVGVSAFQIVGAQYATAVPAIKVSDIAVEASMRSPSVWVISE